MSDTPILPSDTKPARPKDLKDVKIDLLNEDKQSIAGDAELRVESRRVIIDHAKALRKEIEVQS